MAVIGFIGLGNMGAPEAAHLVRAGHQVRGFDLAAGLRAVAEQAGADIALGRQAEALCAAFAHADFGTGGRRR